MSLENISSMLTDPENMKIAAPEGSFDHHIIDVCQINNEKSTSLPATSLAHDFEKKERSSDVLVDGKEGKIDFSGLNLSENMLKGLTQYGFVKPSPIQLRSIPIGKCGVDLLLQAKSGTGKTLVFSIIALEKVNPDDKWIQVVVLAPTREIAYQSSEVMKMIGAHKNIQIENFTGGLPLSDDIGRLNDSQIVCGTPGRIKHLVKFFEMDLSKVSLFVVDEADKLLEPSFFEDLQDIIQKLPKEKQFIAASATYEKGMEDFIVKLMKNPYKIELNKTMPILVAIDHFVLDCRKYTNTKGKLTQEKFNKLNYECIKDILGQINYTRAIIFCNRQSSAETVFDQFKAEKIDVVLLSAHIGQKERIKSFLKIWQKKCGIMVATDLASRGLDCEDMDLVINCDAPNDLETYVHRSGRAGRFGSKGYCFTLLTGRRDYAQITDYQRKLCFDLHFIGSLENLANVAKGSGEIEKLDKLKDETYEYESLLTPEEAKRDMVWMNYLKTRQSVVNYTIQEVVLAGIHIPTNSSIVYENMGIRKLSISEKLDKLRMIRINCMKKTEEIQQIEVDEDEGCEEISSSEDSSEENEDLNEVAKTTDIESKPSEENEDLSEVVKAKEIESKSNSDELYEDSKNFVTGTENDGIKIGQNTSRALSTGIRGGRGLKMRSRGSNRNFNGSQ